MGAEDLVLSLSGEFIKLEFKDGGMMRRLKDGPEKVERAAFLTAQSMAPRVENYMKTNASWTDQTGNARNGLAARAYREGHEIGIVMYHQVPYGVFLESRWSGKYGIINPTIEAMTPVVMARYDRLLERMNF